MQNLSGPVLQVDRAVGKENKELKSLRPTARNTDSPYGDPTHPEEAPELITGAVASLLPEQLFELMKQMKLCMHNSHQEARNMLLQNPQLAYVPVQVRVRMRIMDTEIVLRVQGHARYMSPH